jgi:hypothetical protein
MGFQHKISKKENIKQMFSLHLATFLSIFNSNIIDRRAGAREVSATIIQN